jgi:hypothetical protein
VADEHEEGCGGEEEARGEGPAATQDEEAGAETSCDYAHAAVGGGVQAIEFDREGTGGVPWQEGPQGDRGDEELLRV